MMDCQKKGEPRARSRQTRYRNSFPATLRVTLVFKVQTHSESHKQKNIIWERQQATVTREKKHALTSAAAEISQKKTSKNRKKDHGWKIDLVDRWIQNQKQKKHSLEQMNSPSCARSFHQQHTAKQILTRFVASFFFIYYIYPGFRVGRHPQIQTNKRTEPVHQAEKKQSSPSHVKSSLFFSPMK